MSERPRPADARSPAVDAVWLLLTLLSAAPFWAGELLALTDWPHHLTSAAVVLGFDDPARHLDEAFRLSLTPRPYLGPTYALVALGRVVPIAVAGKLLLTGYAITLAVGVRALVRASGRDPRLAWFGPLFVHQWALAYGFIPYVLSIPFALLAVAASRRALDGPRPAHGAAVVVFTALAALMHPLGVLVAVVASAGLLLRARAALRLWAAHGALWALVGLWGLWASRGVSREGVVFMDHAIQTAWRWSIKHRLVDFSLAYLPGNLDYVVAATGVFALVIALWRGRREGPPDPLDGAAIALGALYLVAPVNLVLFGSRMSLLSPRFIVPLWLFVVPAVRGRVGALAVLGALAAVGHAGLLASTHAEFSARWAGPVRTAVAEIPLGAHVVPQVALPKDSVLNARTVAPPEGTLHAYAMLRAGFDPKLFSTPQGPLHILEAAPAEPGWRWVQTSTSVRLVPTLTRSAR